VKGANGRFLTEALFWETSRDREAYAPVFTLKPEDHEGLPSLKRLYLEHGDPTEYVFAMKVLGSFQHWEALCSASWFKPHIEEWRNELDLRVQSEAVAVAMRVMESGDSDAQKLAAARFLTDKGWKPKQGRGRPSKKEVAATAREMAESASWLNEDFNRVMNVN